MAKAKKTKKSKERHLVDVVIGGDVLITPDRIPPKLKAGFSKSKEGEQMHIYDRWRQDSIRIIPADPEQSEIIIKCLPDKTNIKKRKISR